MYGDRSIHRNIHRGVQQIPIHRTFWGYSVSPIFRSPSFYLSLPSYSRFRFLYSPPLLSPPLRLPDVRHSHVGPRHPYSYTLSLPLRLRSVRSGKFGVYVLFQVSLPSGRVPEVRTGPLTSRPPTQETDGSEHESTWSS